MFVLEAPAKINLFLNVKKELTDKGFHLLESLFMPVSLYDSVSIEVFSAGSLKQSDGIDLHFDPALSCSLSETTVHKAVLAMRDAFRGGTRTEDLLIAVQKRIPEKSGLGGGSADAAATILLLCLLWGLEPLSDEVIAAASSVGADVPFFLFSAVYKKGFYVGAKEPALSEPGASLSRSSSALLSTYPPFFEEAKAAYLKGIGDEFEYAIDALNLNIVLAKNADDGVSTVQAYQTFDAEGMSGKNGDIFLAAYKEEVQKTNASSIDQNNALDLSSDTFQELFSAMGNNLEPIALKLSPSIQEVRRFLIERDGVCAAMVTGSGSSVFGVCSTFQKAEEIAFAARERGWWAEAVTTRCAGLKPILC